MATKRKTVKRKTAKPERPFTVRIVGDVAVEVEGVVMARTRAEAIKTMKEIADLRVINEFYRDGNGNSLEAADKL